jgi:hypothetical protein
MAGSRHNHYRDANFSVTRDRTVTGPIFDESPRTAGDRQKTLAGVTVLRLMCSARRPVTVTVTVGHAHCVDRRHCSVCLARA